MESNSRAKAGGSKSCQTETKFSRSMSGTDFFTTSPASRFLPGRSRHADVGGLHRLSERAREDAFDKRKASREPPGQPPGLLSPAQRPADVDAERRVGRLAGYLDGN